MCLRHAKVYVLIDFQYLIIHLILIYNVIICQIVVNERNSVQASVHFLTEA